MDTRIYVKPIFNRLTKETDTNHHVINTNTWLDFSLQKKIKKRNKILEKPKIRKICSDYEKENEYIWNSDPVRQGKEVYDSGEVKELDEHWNKEAVTRDSKRGLIRDSTGRPVCWSKIQGKWVDLIREDRSKWK